MSVRGPSVSHAPLDFASVFAQHCRFVWRVLARLGVPSADVPDVCQEVFLIVHRRLPDFDPSRGALGSWMYGICLRAASDHRRRRSRRPESTEAQALGAAMVGSPLEEISKRRAWQHLEHVLNEMDANKREAFVLYELEGLPMNEVAVIMNCPIQTAYARLHAARRIVLAAFETESEP